MTTLVHLGDFHAAPGPRNSDRYLALSQIIDAGARLSTLGAWLWPGDLNHGRMSIEDRNRLTARLQLMAAIAPVVLCYGNHDLPGDLDVFQHLRTTWPIHVIDTPQTLRLTLATGELATIFVLPYPTRAGLIAAGLAPADALLTAADLLEPIFMQAAADLADARARGHVTLMIGHVNVAGSLMSAGQPNIGHEIELSPRHLDRLGPIYKGLNHIHKAQTIAGATYAGSICRLSWGEIEEKRWLEVRIGRELFQPDKTMQVSGVFSHPIDVAPMYHVEGDLTRDGFTWAVTDGPGGDVQPAPATWAGAEVRVRYRFKASEQGTLARAHVLAAFADAAKLEVEPIAVRDHELRAPDVVAARTLAEKLAAYAKVEALAPVLLDKLAALELSEPTVVLTAIQQALAAIERVEEKATVAA